MKHFFILLFFLLVSSPLFAAERWGIVIESVADLRASSGSVATSYDLDPLQETQLLYGEIVKIIEEQGDWLKVEAIEQQEFSHNNRWEGYPGWVKKDAVLEINKQLKKRYKPNFVVKKKKSFIEMEISTTDSVLVTMPLSLGTKLFAGKLKKRHAFYYPGEKVDETDFQLYRPVEVEMLHDAIGWIKNDHLRSLEKKEPEKKLRKLIVESASELLGDLYFWGGRSAHIPELKEQVTAVDCSGLVNLAYRVAGMDIPRDSLEQFMKAKKIKRAEVKMGDLIFSASKEKPEKISHVSIFIDTNRLIEAPQTGQVVRVVSFQEKYGVQFEELENGRIAGERIIYFGTYFEK